MSALGILEFTRKRWARKIRRNLSYILMAVPVIAGILVPALLFPLNCVGCIAGAGLLVFLFGRSRSIYDPVSGMGDTEPYPPRIYHSWCKRVCTSPGYKASYAAYFLNQEGSRFSKIRLAVSHGKAKHHFRAPIVLGITLSIVLALELVALRLGDRGFAWKWPIPTGIVLGVFWGYATGVYQRWVVCSRAN